MTPFFLLRVRRGLNNACTRVHYTPRVPGDRLTGSESGDRRQDPGDRNSRSRNNQERPQEPQNAPQGLAWYGIPCSEQNAAGGPESAAERKPGTVSADRAGLHTTDFLSCDNMTVRGYKKTLNYHAGYAIIQSRQGKYGTRKAGRLNRIEPEARRISPKYLETIQIRTGETPGGKYHVENYM